MRHGAITGFARKTYVGQIDIPLSPEGIEQAKTWHRFFQSEPPDKIICSDLVRCRVTADIIAGTSQHIVRVEKAFREISLGLWEGVAMDEVRKNYPQQWERRGRNLKTFRPPKGESFSDLSDRVLPVFENVCKTDSHCIVIVAHAGVNRVILADIMAVDLNQVLDIPQDYAAGNLILLASGKKQIVYINKQAP